MAKSLKTAGVDSLQDFVKRVRRQRTLKRISREDAAWLESKAQEIEAYVVSMYEQSPDNERDF